MPSGVALTTWAHAAAGGSTSSTTCPSLGALGSSGSRASLLAGHSPPFISADLEMVSASALDRSCLAAALPGSLCSCYLNLVNLRLLKRSRYLPRLLQLKLLEGWGRYCACRVAFGGERLFPSSHSNSFACSREDALLSGSFACRGAAQMPSQNAGLIGGFKVMGTGSPPEPPPSGAAPAHCQPAVTQLTQALPASHLCLLAPERGRT